MSITDEEFEIFSRQLILKEFNENLFIKLQKKKISVVGMGAIGCPLAQYLISSRIKNINLFDDDVIEKNNLNRQNLYSIKDVGQKKIIIAKKKLRGINPKANIILYPEKITDSNVSLLKNSLLII